MENQKLTLKVYDDKDNVVKTCDARFVDLRFGTIRKILQILKIDQVNDTSELLRTLYSAWTQITGILEKAFPDMNEDDWDYVKLSELMPLLLQILRGSFALIATIPTDEKNSMAE